MYSLTKYIVLYLTIACILADSINEEDLTNLQDHITCERVCRAKYQRSCGNVHLPPYCGQCMTNYVERDGVCLSLYRDVLNPESEIDQIAASRNHQRKAARGTSENNDYNTAAKKGDIDSKSSSNSTAAGNQHNQPQVAPQTQPHHIADTTLNSGIFIAVVAGCSVAGVIGLIVAGVCWYRLQKNVKAASEVDYPAYGVTGPTNGKERLGSPGDRKLAQSAQMYHYQHQKQQMIAMEKAHGDLNKDGSEVDSEEENEEGDYTVFECPGLAPTGEMEVKNPLFSEDTPVTPSGGDTRSEHK